MPQHPDPSTDHAPEPGSRHRGQAPRAVHGERHRPAGPAVEIWNPFVSAWVDGFELLGVRAGECSVLRSSDGAILPVPLSASRVRRVRT